MKKAVLSFLTLLIFFILPHVVQAEVDDFSVNEWDNGFWQIDTPEPTEKQLLLLYDVTNGDELNVDDSQVNYGRLGEYEIFFSLGNAKQVAVKMTIQKNTPIRFTQKQLLQIELGNWASVEDDAIKKMINRENFWGYSFELIGHGIDPTTIGRYPISVTVTDKYGRTVNEEMVADVVDMQVPQIQVVNERLHYDKDATITTEQLMKDAQITVSDDETASHKILIEWFLEDMTTKIAGDYKVGIQATDAHQNISPITYITVTVGEANVLKKKMQYEVNKRPSLEKMKRDLGSKDIKTIQMNQVDFSRVAVYQMPVILKDDSKKKVQVSIVDTEAPRLVANATTLEYAQSQKLTEQQLISDLQLEYSDNYDRELEVVFSKTMEQLETAGQHQVTVSTTDSSGNESSLAITIQIGQADTEAALLKKSSPTDSDVTWEYVKMSEEESEFTSKIFTPTIDEETSKSQLLQQGEAVAAELNGTELKEGEYLKIIFLILLFIAMIVGAFSIVTAMKSKKIVVRNKPKNRRYTKG